ncbi:hypothetical protein ACWDRR_33650 [Kitasatospora sp. NPDC003701]
MPTPADPHPGDPQGRRHGRRGWPGPRAYAVRALLGLATSAGGIPIWLLTHYWLPGR